MIILEAWTGELYALAPGDIIGVLDIEQKEKDGSTQTLWRVVVQQIDNSIIHISKTYTDLHSAHIVFDAIKGEIAKGASSDATYFYIESSAFMEEEA